MCTPFSLLLYSLFPPAWPAGALAYHARGGVVSPGILPMGDVALSDIVSEGGVLVGIIPVGRSMCHGAVPLWTVSL